MYACCMVETHDGVATADAGDEAEEEEDFDDDLINTLFPETDDASGKLEAQRQKILKAIKKHQKEKHRLPRRQSDQLQSAELIRNRPERRLAADVVVAGR